MGLLNKKELTSSAEVIDNHLILSLPNAIEPIVWRMALDKIGTASFEVKQIKDKDNFKLILKPKKGAAETIAVFDKKDDTLEALIHASNALQKPETANSNQSNHNKTKATKELPSKGKKPTNKWFLLFLGFLAVIGLYTYMLSLLPQKIDAVGVGQQAGAPTSGAAATGEPQTGVPLSADDFLNGL